MLYMISTQEEVSIVSIPITHGTVVVDYYPIGTKVKGIGDGLT